MLNKNNLNNILLETIKTIKSGGLVIAPFDTVYGIVCNAKNTESIRKIFDFKERPLEKTIGIAVSSVQSMSEIAKISDENREFIKEKTPGRYTFIVRIKKPLLEISHRTVIPVDSTLPFEALRSPQALEERSNDHIAPVRLSSGPEWNRRQTRRVKAGILKSEIPELLSQTASSNSRMTEENKQPTSISNYCIKNGTIGVRIPDSKLILKIINKSNLVLAQTSANKSGKRDCFSVNDLLNQYTSEQLEKIDLIIDGGVISGSQASIIIDLTESKPKVIER